MILIYAVPEDAGFIEEARRRLKQEFPDTRMPLRNPRFHRSRYDVERCDAVCVRPDYPQVAKDYEAAGIPVLVGPPFAEMPVDASEKFQRDPKASSEIKPDATPKPHRPKRAKPAPGGKSEETT